MRKGFRKQHAVCLHSIFCDNVRFVAKDRTATFRFAMPSLDEIATPRIEPVGLATIRHRQYLALRGQMGQPRDATNFLDGVVLLEISQQCQHMNISGC